MTKNTLKIRVSRNQMTTGQGVGVKRIVSAIE